MNKTIAIIDDHAMMREGIKAWIESKTEWKVTGSFENTEAVLDFLAHNLREGSLPEIVIIDIDLGNENGFDLLKTITAEYPDIKSIMYSMHQEQVYALQSKQYGAKGYISKASDSDEFLKCIEVVSKGGSYLEQSMIETNNVITSYMTYLTKKEQAVLQEVLKGKVNEEIAASMDLTLHTIEVYVSKIYDKLGTSSREELIRKFK